MLDKERLRQRRHRRIRKRVYGTAEKPRLCVFRSNAHIYAQIIDDDAQSTLCSASTLDAEVKPNAANGGNAEAAKLVGELLGKRAKDKGIETVCFDRGGFKYHGRIAAMADAAREAGLKF